MKKLLISTAMAAMFGAMASPVMAATASNNFNVSVTLSSQCRQTNTGTQTVDFGTYTAFQAGAQASVASASLTFECTRGFSPVSSAFDTVLADSTAAGVGVVQGLQYALTAAAPTNLAGTAASSVTIGSGDTKTYVVSGSMPALQAGACAAASCGPTTQLRTLIVTF